MLSCTNNCGGSRTESGFSWLLEELDDATAIGVVEVKSLRQQTRQGLTTYEELTLLERTGPGRRRAEEFLSHRPMTLLEQVDALIDALTRVLVDLDEVAVAAVIQLNDLPVAAPSDDDPSVAPRRGAPKGRTERDAEGTYVSEIRFEPDEGSLAPAVTTEEMRHNTDRRISSSTLLREIQDLAHE